MATRALVFVVALLLSSCAFESGEKLAAPITASLTSIHKNATSVLESGAKPQDQRVQEIIKSDVQAQKQIVVITKEYTTAITLYDKKVHRIFIDDCVFAVVAFIILLPIIIKLAPFLMAL